MKKTTIERLLKFLECADNVCCERTEYRDDYIFKGKIYISSEEAEEFQELVSNTTKDDNSIKMKKLITEERSRLLRKRKDDIERELKRLESGFDVSWKF